MPGGAAGGGGHGWRADRSSPECLLFVQDTGRPVPRRSGGAGIGNGEPPGHRQHPSSLTFLHWLSDHDCPGSTWVAEVGSLQPPLSRGYEGVPGLLAKGSGLGHACPVLPWPLPSQIMGEDLWPHPLPYYPREGGRHQPAGEVTERRRRRGAQGKPWALKGVSSTSWDSAWDSKGRACGSKAPGSGAASSASHTGL